MENLDFLVKKCGFLGGKSWILEGFGIFGKKGEIFLEKNVDLGGEIGIFWG